MPARGGRTALLAVGCGVEQVPVRGGRTAPLAVGCGVEWVPARGGQIVLLKVKQFERQRLEKSFHPVFQDVLQAGHSSAAAAAVHEIPKQVWKMTAGAGFRPRDVLALCLSGSLNAAVPGQTGALQKTLHLSLFQVLPRRQALLALAWQNGQKVSREKNRAGQNCRQPCRIRAAGCQKVFFYPGGPDRSWFHLFIVHHPRSIQRMPAQEIPAVHGFSAGHLE